jgi:hypothetical protein
MTEAVAKTTTVNAKTTMVNAKGPPQLRFPAVA